MRLDRRRLAGAAVLALAPGALLSGRAFAAETASAAALPVRVVASFSILADIVRNVAGSAAIVDTLVGPDSDAHVFEPTPLHARRLGAAELVIVNGFGLEGWLPRLIEASGYRGPVLVASSGIVARRAAGVVDPHVWQSLADGRQMAGNISRGLVQARPARRAELERRGAAYAALLAELDGTLRTRFDAIPREQRRVVTSHVAFGYFGDAYGIDFYAPLGSSTESEPSAAAVARLSRQIRQQAIRAVFIENIADPRLVSRIAQESGATVGGRLYSDALSAPGTEADTYLRLYAHNAATIAAALQGPHVDPARVGLLTPKPR